MDTQHVNPEWFLKQLTLARWHLDRVAVVALEAAPREIETARATYDQLAGVLQQAAASAEQRARLHAELYELKARLSALDPRSWQDGEVRPIPSGGS